MTEFMIKEERTARIVLAAIGGLTLYTLVAFYTYHGLHAFVPAVIFALILNSVFRWFES